MAAGSTIKMGVDVTQFKQGMRDAQNSVKTLDAELKKSKAEFAATGDKEKYMADQSKILKQKLEEQKTAIKNAQKALDEMRNQGVKQTSQEYQKMAQQLAAAQTGMYNTQAALNDLNTSQVQAAQSAGQLTNNIAGISKKMSLQQVLGGLKSIDNVLKSAATYAIQIGRNLYGGLTEGAAEADDLLTLSLQTGIDVETLQKMTLAGKIFDTSVDTIVAARRKLNRNVQGENKNVDEALEALGIKKFILTSKDKGYLEKKVKDSQDLFWEIGEALMNEPNEDRRDSYAQTLFGRNFDDLYPLFSKGREEYESFLDSQSAVSEENIKKLGELSDQLDKMNYQFEQAKTNLLASFAPALEKVSGVVTNMLEEFNKYLETPEGQQKMQDLSDAVTSLFKGLEDISPEDVLNTAISAIDSLKGALEWIGNNWEGVVTGLKAIVGVWTGVKAIEGATTIINMVNGLKGLGAGGAAEGAAAGESWGISFGAAVLKAVPWLVGLIEFTRGIWDPNYHGSTENDSYYEGSMRERYDIPDEADIPTEALNLYRTMAETNVDMQKTDEAMKEYGLIVRKEVEEATKNSQEKSSRLEQLRKAGLYEASWLIGGDKTSYNRLQEYWDLYRSGEATPQDWQDMVSYFTEGKNRNGYDQTSLLRVLQRMYGLDKNMEDLPNEVFGLDAELNLTDDAQEILQTQANGLEPISVPGMINLHYGEEEIGSRGEHGFANGIWSVPWDGYPAILHKGERVVPASQARQYTYNNNTYFGNVNLQNGLEVDALSESIARQNRRHQAGYGS